ncbi:MAG: DUF971 domain-containing protein, partial [Solimonas sp.]
RLVWTDGESRLSAALLRERCRCAGCRGREARGIAPGAAPALRITTVEAMGYGLHLCFSDGHDRGIYPWAYLRELAQAAQPS